MLSLTVSEIAKIGGGSAEGDAGRVIAGANALESAAAHEVSYVANDKAGQAALRSKAGCLIVPKGFEGSGPWAIVRVADPRISFVRVLKAIYPEKALATVCHQTAVVAPTARLGPNTCIGPYVTVEEETEIGAGTAIGAGSRIGSGVAIGKDCRISPNVVIGDGTRMGDRVILHAGCVIGADGFGFTLVNDYYEKFPQVGVVVIEDDVEIGANSCIDRAALGVTRIGTGAKIDNLVHIAHNCTIGRHVVIAAQAGLSGGVSIGDYAFVGGQTGMGDKASIAPRAIVAAKSGILTSQHIGAGEPVWGIPARPLKQHLKNLAHVSRLPAMREELRDLQKRVSRMENGETNS